MNLFNAVMFIVVFNPCSLFSFQKKAPSWRDKKELEVAAESISFIDKNNSRKEKEPQNELQFIDDFKLRYGNGKYRILNSVEDDEKLYLAVQSGEESYLILKFDKKKKYIDPQNYYSVEEISRNAGMILLAKPLKISISKEGQEKPDLLIMFKRNFFDEQVNSESVKEEKIVLPVIFYREMPFGKNSQLKLIDTETLKPLSNKDYKSHNTMPLQIQSMNIDNSPLIASGSDFPSLLLTDISHKDRLFKSVYSSLKDTLLLATHDSKIICAEKIKDSVGYRYGDSNGVWARYTIFSATVTKSEKDFKIDSDGKQYLKDDTGQNFEIWLPDERKKLSKSDGAVEFKQHCLLFNENKNLIVSHSFFPRYHLRDDNLIQISTDFVTKHTELENDVFSKPTPKKNQNDEPTLQLGQTLNSVVSIFKPSSETYYLNDKMYIFDLENKKVIPLQHSLSDSKNKRILQNTRKDPALMIKINRIGFFPSPDSKTVLCFFNGQLCSIDSKGTVKKFDITLPTVYRSESSAERIYQFPGRIAATYKDDESITLIFEDMKQSRIYFYKQKESDEYVYSTQKRGPWVKNKFDDIKKQDNLQNEDELQRVELVDIENDVSSAEESNAKKERQRKMKAILKNKN